MEEPLVSYCIISYNQEYCIKEALESAISQDYKNMEIIVSDDNSKDNTFSVIKEFFAKYKGNFKIILNQNSQNLFITGNLNKAIGLSHGKYIIFSAGDDTKTGPDSVRKFVKYIREMNVLCLTSNANIIDENSVNKGTVFPISDKNTVFSIQDYLKGNIRSCGAARIIDRDLLEIFGLLSNDCQTEDSTTNLRAILTKGLGYISSPLVNYRIDGNNVSIGLSVLNKFEPKRIYSQYLNDLNIAKDKGLIEIETYKLIKHAIDKYLHKEIAKRKIYKKNYLLSRLWIIFKLTITFNYSLRELYSFILFSLRGCNKS